MSIFTQSYSKYTKTVKIIHFRSINSMKHIKKANTWNLAANAQPQIPTLSLSIKILFQTYRVPTLGHRSAGAQPHSSHIFQRQALLGYAQRWSSRIFQGSTSHQKKTHILVFVGRCFTWFHDPNWHLHGSVV